MGKVDMKMETFRNMIIKELEIRFSEMTQLSNRCLEFIFTDVDGIGFEVKTIDKGNRSISKHVDAENRTTYFGSGTVTNLNIVLPGNLIANLDQDNCEFHIKHGIYISLKSKNDYLPSNWSAQPSPCLHIFLDNGEWAWRLVRSLPKDFKSYFSTDGLLQKFIDELKEGYISASLSESETTNRHIGNLPQWCDSPMPWQNSKSELAPLTFPLIGVGLTIKIRETTLLFKPSWFRATQTTEGHRIELLETTDIKTDTSMNYWLELKSTLIQLEQGWDLSFSVLTLDETDSTGQYSDIERAMWIHAAENDEWLRIGFNDYAKDTMFGESRRWSIGTLLDGFPETAVLEIWLDNSGFKTLQADFNNDGTLKILRLGFKKPAVELCLNPNVFFTRYGALDALPLLQKQGPNDLQSNRGAVLISHPLQEDAPLTINLKKNGSFTIAGNEGKVDMVHWVRSKASLVSPVEWSRNDPAAVSGISRFRGLLPLNSNDLSVNFENSKPAEIVCGKGEYSFPTFAKGKRLLVASPHSKLSGMELEIKDINDAELFQRHALPHLDTFYAKVYSEIPARDEIVKNDESLTWVKERFYDTVNSVETITAAGTLLKESINNGVERSNADVKHKKVHSIKPESSQSNLFSVVWYAKWCRWSAFVRDPLTNCLGDKFLVDVLTLNFEKDKISGLDFTILPRLPIHQVPIRGTKLTYTLNDNQIKGNLFLGEETLVSNCGQLSNGEAASGKIEWLHRKRQSGLKETNGPNVEFLGLESENVTITIEIDKAKLSLRELIYWFRSDGIQFSVQTNDQMSFEDGKWKFSDESCVSLVSAHVGEKILATFTNESKIAPGVTVVEKLLAFPQERLLVFKYSDDQIEFDVRTSYYNCNTLKGLDGDERVPEGNDSAPEALLRAGNYHLAWAGGGKAKTSPNDIISGLTLGKLTRLFLLLQRNNKGKLITEKGMIGWQCKSLTVDDTQFESTDAFATVYANSGRWSNLRLRGKWQSEATVNNEFKPREIALFRIDLPLKNAVKQPLSIGRGNSAPILVEYESRSSTSEKKSICFQSLTIDGTGDITLVGEVRFVPYKPANITTSYKVHSQQISSLSAKWIDPLQLLNGLVSVSNDIPWYAIEIPELIESPLALMSRKGESLEGKSKVIVKPKGDHRLFAGLTRKTESEQWLICPVTHVDKANIQNKGPKLWLIHEDGEDLVQLDGFEEKLSDKLKKTGLSKDETKRLQKKAEEMLSFMRWRTPAVLEFWPEDREAPVWRIVDAPLLNPFSSLAFMNPRMAANFVNRQKDAGFINVTSLPIHAPKVASSSERFDTSAVLITREIPFENGPEVSDFSGKDPWLADSAAWSNLELDERGGEPGDAEMGKTNAADQAGIAEDGAESGGQRRGLLPEVKWTMATPRPGELLSFMAETVWNKKGNGIESNQLLISDVSVVTERSDRRAGFSTLKGFELSGNTVIWPIGPGVRPEEIPIKDSGMTLLIGAPDAKSLSLIKTFSIAVIDSKAAEVIGADEREEKKALVLRFSLPFEFRLDISSVGSVESQKSEGEDEVAMHEAFVTFPPGSHGKPFTGLIETKSEVTTTRGNLEIFQMVAGDATNPHFEKQETEIVDRAKSLVLEPSDAREQTPIPTTVAILDLEGRLLAYGPGNLNYRIVSTENRLVWQAYGEWDAHDKELAERAKSVLLIAHDGSITEITRKP